MSAIEVALRSLRDDLERQRSLVAMATETLGRANELQANAVANLEASRQRVADLQAAIDTLEDQPDEDDAEEVPDGAEARGGGVYVGTEPPAAEL